VVKLVQSGRAYVKISAAYRSSDKAPGYGDVAPLPRALITANPHRVVWGTDRPHPHAPRSGAAVTDDIAWCCLPPIGFRKWAGDPFSRWVRGDSQP